MVNEVVTRKSLTLFTLLLLVLSTLSIPAYCATLTVETDREQYFIGEYITISCTAPPGESVNIVVRNENSTVFDTTIVVPQEGNVTVTFLLIGAQLGEHVVTAQTDSEGAETSFLIADGDCKLTHDLLELMFMSQDKTHDILLERLEDNPSEETGWYKEFLLAEEVAMQAKELYEEGFCKEAAAKATESLRLYGKSLKLAEEAGEGLVVDVSNLRAEKVLEFKAAIERVYCYLEKVRATSMEFAEKGFDVSVVNSLVDKALRLLMQCEELLEEGGFERAEGLISEAKILLNEAMRLIQELNEVNKLEKAMRFLAETRERLGLMEERIINILGNLGVQGQVLQAIGDVFNTAKAGIEEVQALLEAGEFKDAINEFKEVFDDTEESLQVVEGFDGDKRGLLNEIEELEAKTRYLIDKVESLSNSGADTAGLWSLIEKIKLLIHNAVHSLEEGNLETVKNFIAEAWPILGRLKEEISYHSDSTQVLDSEAHYLLMHIDELEAVFHHLVQKVDELQGAGCDVSAILPYIEKAKQLVAAAVGSLQEGDKKSATSIISELEWKLEYIENRIREVMEACPYNVETSEGNSEGTGTSNQEGLCKEEDIIAFKLRLEELERMLAHLSEVVKSLGEAGAELEVYLHTATKLFFELTEMTPCEEATSKKMYELVDLLEKIEVKAKIIQDTTVSVSSTEFWYYRLEMGEEKFGKFEFMVVTTLEEESRIVFEEGLVYDCFLEWIMTTENEIYDPMNGTVTSVYRNGEETVTLYFLNAVPFSWRGTGLDNYTGESHAMERLELAVSFVEEA